MMMKSKRSLPVLIFVVLLVLSLVVPITCAKKIKHPEAREEILASREKRRRQLENILDHVKEQLEDHYSGKSPLDKKQVDHHEHKVRAYEHQLGELNRELDEEDIQRRIENYQKLKAGTDEL